jgi:predicted nucleotidyltransferase
MYNNNQSDIDPTIIAHNAPMDNAQLLAALERLVSAVEARNAR